MNLDGIPPKALELAVGCLFGANVYWISKLIKTVDLIDSIVLDVAKLKENVLELQKAVRMTTKRTLILSDMTTKSIVALSTDMNWVRERLGKLEAKFEKFHERKAT